MATMTLAERMAANRQAANRQAAKTANAPSNGENENALTGRAKMFDDIAKARASNNRIEDVPLGTGWYLINDIKYVKTQDAKNTGVVYHLDKVSLKALAGKCDASGLRPGEPGYNGAVVGTDYEWTIWRNGQWSRPAEEYMKLVKVFGNFLSEGQGCHAPLTEEEIDLLKVDPDYLMAFIQQCVGFTFGDSWTEGEDGVSSLSGLGIVEITVKETVKNKKKDGKEIYVKNDDGELVPQQVTYRNVYLNRQVSVAEAFTALGDDEDRIKNLLGETVMASLAAVA